MVTSTYYIHQRHVLSLSVLHIYRDQPCYPCEGNEEKPRAPKYPPFPTQLCVFFWSVQSSKSVSTKCLLFHTHARDISSFPQHGAQPTAAAVRPQESCFCTPEVHRLSWLLQRLTAVFNYNRLTVSVCEGLNGRLNPRYKGGGGQGALIFPGMRPKASSFKTNNKPC